MRGIEIGRYGERDNRGAQEVHEDDAAEEGPSQRWYDHESQRRVEKLGKLVEVASAPREETRTDQTPPGAQKAEVSQRQVQVVAHSISAADDTKDVKDGGGSGTMNAMFREMKLKFRPKLD